MPDIKHNVPDCRPLLAVDFDDVIFDCDGALTKILRCEFDCMSTYIEFFRRNPHLQKEIFRFLYGSYHQKCVAIDGACDAISHLSKAYQIVVITGRSEAVKQQTEVWLEDNFPDMFSEIYFTNTFLSEPERKKRKKVDICLGLDVKILIDDSWEEAVSVSSVGIKVLLFDRHWNRGMDKEFPPNVFRARNWNHIFTDLLQTPINRR